jgi:hypothetical protein
MEPCAGRGNISVELERCGYNVTSFDLHKYDNLLTKVSDGQDFMSLSIQLIVQILLTKTFLLKMFMEMGCSW